MLMLTEMLAQLRFAASVAFGVSFNIRSLERLVDAIIETRREFGAIGADGADLLRTAEFDDEARREVHLRRFRTQASRAARETACYGACFDRLGLDPSRLSMDDLGHLPLTRKEALQADPDAFISRRSRPAHRCTTTGTTGRPVSVAFSADEMRSYVLLSAMSLLVTGKIGADDVVQISTSARATLGNLCFSGACTRIGALVHAAGLVDPAHTLALLAEERKIARKKRRVSVLMTYPSHLGELVESAPALGFGPESFGVERLIVGGELVTEGLKARARRLFGDVPVDEGYGMTEIWPLGGIRCPDDHLHHDPTQGLIEVIDPLTGTVTGGGQLGTIVVTPFAPYRHTTLLLRYDTEDVVRRLVDSPTCSLRHLPATGHLLGKLRLAVRRAHGWTLPRDVLEALEAVDDVPLPARYGFWAVPGGVGVEVVARTDSIGTRRRIERSLDDHGIPVRELRLVLDRQRLKHPLPLRCELREMAFTAHQPAALGIDPDGPSHRGSRPQAATATASVGAARWT